MRLLCTAFAALGALLLTSNLVSSQSCPAEADSDLLWPEQQGTAALTCRPVTFPSGNRQLTHSGQRLNTYFTYWRSSQTITSPLPIALVITFHSQTCLFSKALLPLMDEVAQQYARQSIRFIKVDTAQLAYSDLIKMGITSVPVIRLHTQVKRLTYSGDRSLAALTQYITNYTEIAVVPQQDSDQLAFDLNQTVYTKAPEQVATASIEDMRDLSRAPLTLLASLISVLFLMEVLWKRPCMQRARSWLQQQGHR
ncbi:hypothetical protein WJX82_004931 [Trebouxia sp. C0006]